MAGVLLGASIFMLLGFGNPRVSRFGGRDCCWLGALAVVGLLLAAGGRAWAGGGPQNTLIVVNSRSAASLEVANEYQRLRGIPEGNIVYLPAANTAVFYAGGDLLRMIPIATFRANVLAPVLGHIRSRGLAGQIDMVVFSTDFPNKVDATLEAGGPIGASLPRCSLTSAMAFGDLIEAPGSGGNLVKRSMFSFRQYAFDAGNPATFTTNLTHQTSWNPAVPSRYYVSTLLGWTHAYGNTVDEIKTYLRSATEADGSQPNGTVYIDFNPDLRSNLRKPQFPAAKAELLSLGVNTIILSNNPAPFSLVGKANVIGAALGAPSPVIPAGSTFLKGAIAEHLTSWAGVLDFNDAGQTRATLWLSSGAAGTAGMVTEPADPVDTPDKWPAVRLHAHYARGCSLGEAFYQSVTLPYQLLILGDPLCRPYATIPTVTLGGLADGEIFGGVRTLTPQATTSAPGGIAGFELFLDGVSWGRVAPGGSVNFDTTTLADGAHELRVVAYENSPIRTQGQRVLNFRANNLDQDIQLSATAFTRVDGSGPFALGVNVVGGAPAAIEIRKGALLLATVAGASGSASIDPSLLGRGRSILRGQAVMSSGLVRTAAIVVDVLAPTDNTPPTLPRFRAFTAANSIMNAPSDKAAFRAGDFVYLGLVPSEPIGLVGNLSVTVGSGRVAPFLFRWNGLSSTSVVPGLSGATNEIIFRYQLSRTLDAEGPVPVVVNLRDAAGNATTVTKFFLADYTPPVVSAASFSTGLTNVGGTVAITFAPNEALSARPTLAINGASATFVSSNGLSHTFAYTVRAGDASGPTTLLLGNLVDLAGNSGSSQFTKNPLGDGGASPPTITAPPASVTTAALTTATFTVGATGTGPLNFQWFFNGNTPIPGANSATLTLNSVTANHTGNYSVAVANSSGSVTSSVVTLTVNRLVPALTWATPAAITYGTALSGAQLNASAAGVAGTLVYNPAAGAVLPAGTRSLAVGFTPNDASVFTSAGASVNLAVNPAPLTITADNKARAFGQPNPPLTASYNGFVNGESPAVLSAQPILNTSATLASPAGNYPITVSGAAAANYAVTPVNGTLSVTSADPAITTQPTNVAVLLSSNATFTASAIGTAPLNYQWLFNGTNLLPGATSASLLVPNAQLANAGGYSVVVANPVGSVTSLVAVLTVLPPPATNLYGDNFEGKANGSNLNADPRWTAFVTGDGLLVATAFVTNNPTAPGSTRSAVFKDAPGKTQIYWFAMTNAATAAAVEFDVFLDDRNPTGDANLEVRASTAKTNFREVGLLLRQTAGANTWEVAVARADGIVVLTNGLPLRSWHRVRFDNDVATNTYSVVFDGVALATRTLYAAPIQSLTTVNNFQFRNNSDDEDVYLDNLALPLPGVIAPPPPPLPPGTNFYGDDFEGKTVGDNLNVDPRWSAFVSTTFNLSATAFVTDNPVAAGSTRAAVFRGQANGARPIYWFALTNPVPAVAVEFDVFLDDRNPATAAVIEIRASVDHTNFREVGLLLRQTAGAGTWEVAVSALTGTTVYQNNLPLRTWFHLRFENDVANNSYSVSLNGALLANRVLYATPIQTVALINNIQFRLLSTDEDVYLDNVSIPPATAPNPVVPLVAPLVAKPAPLALSAEQFASDTLTATFPTRVGRTYLIQGSSDLVRWEALQSLLADDTSITTTLALSPGQIRFWRVVEVP